MMLKRRNPPGLAPRRVSEEDGLYSGTFSMPHDQPEGKAELPADLKSTTVMAASVLHLDTLVQEIQAERSSLRRLTLAQIEVLKAFSDLYVELTGESEHRKFLDRSIRKAEREAQRLRLPLWFWRPEPELELKVQLYRRARFLLFEQKACLDDAFDLTREFVDDYAKPETPVTDEQISGIIEFAHRKGGVDASSN